MQTNSCGIFQILKGTKTVSGQVRQELAQYVGIINGIIYRIETSLGQSGQMFEFVPMEAPSVPAGEHFETLTKRPPPAETPEARSKSAASFGAARTPDSPAGAEAVAVEAAGGTAPVQVEESPAKPFARDGAEPLRAGHPDLWRLLVAGTCLEGSTFRSV